MYGKLAALYREPLRWGGWGKEENSMKAIVQEKYGSPDILELKDIDNPMFKDDEVLVRVTPLPSI